MLRKMPWGDYLEGGAVLAITIDREGTGFIVVVTLLEGFEVRSSPFSTEFDAENEADRVAVLLSQ